MNRLARIQTAPLDINEVLSAVTRPEAGALATFSGLVRNHADGQPVILLEYEAYPSMAEKEMARIIEAIQVEIPDVHLAAVHRVGSLQVGELAIICAASAPHRGEALRACQLLIERIKERVPIWKREHGPDGPYWVGWQDARCVASVSHGGDSRQHAHHHHSAAGHAEMGQVEPAASALVGIKVALLTVSDTRKVVNDHSGRAVRELLVAQGATIVAIEILPDEPERIRALVQNWARTALADAIVITGGTGIAARDQTIEAVEPLLSRRLDGFGETFRRLSFDEVGSHALLSRALAGIVDASLLFALPGSPGAVRLAINRLVIPMLPHACKLIRGQPGLQHGGV